jgi:hypothetical protein
MFILLFQVASLLEKMPARFFKEVGGREQNQSKYCWYEE